MAEPTIVRLKVTSKLRWSQIQRGDQVKFRRDPKNPYDANAVEIIHGTGMIGFIPKDVAAELAPQLDEGIKFTATIYDVCRETGKHRIDLSFEAQVDKPSDFLGLGF